MAGGPWGAGGDPLGRSPVSRDPNPPVRLFQAPHRRARALRPRYGSVRAPQPGRRAEVQDDPAPAGGATDPPAQVLGNPRPRRADGPAVLPVAQRAGARRPRSSLTSLAGSAPRSGWTRLYPNRFARSSYRR